MANASFFACELNEFNTGWKFINGTCSSRSITLGLSSRPLTCGHLRIETKFSSASFKFRDDWSVVVRGNHVYDRVKGPTHRLDLTLKELSGSAAARALPHGLVGQSFASSKPREGKVDHYPRAGRYATSAMAEGAIEGVASMYEMPSPFATRFAFSRFDAAEVPVPSRWPLASYASQAVPGSERVATSTERAEGD